jgi:hypothetical protein
VLLDICAHADTIDFSAFPPFRSTFVRLNT